MGLAVRQIQRYAEADALAFAAETIGPCPDWRESLRAYRWEDSFEEDWEIEAGRWLLFARDQGFLEALVDGCLAEERTAAARRVGPENRDAARRLWAELAPAMVAYYLVSSGWSLASWQGSGFAGAVPLLRLRSPTGCLTAIQILTPGAREGRLEARVPGNGAAEASAAVEEGAGSLAEETGVARLVVLVPERRHSIDLEALAELLVGRPTADGHGEWGIGHGSRGTFARGPCSRLHAVVDLSLRRGVSRRTWTEEPLYRCTVFTNPWAAPPLESGALALPFAHVLALEGGKFVWQPDEPEWCAAFRTGLFFKPRSKSAERRSGR